VDELRVNIADVQATAICYRASAETLAADAPSTVGRSFQPSAAAVQAVHAGTAITRAVLSARTLATGIGVAAADACYAKNEAESAAELHTLDSPVV
jgi:hypothetical protein